MPAKKIKRNILPGFGITMGVTLTYLSLIVLIPLAALFWRSTELTWHEFWQISTNARVLASYRISFGGAFIASIINVFTGFLLAWVISRYDFPGKRLMDAAIDLPFALPTAVAGISLTAVYSPNGWIGSYLKQIGIQAVYNPLGIIIAMTFISLPFMVRTVQPVLEEMQAEWEEASATLGASRLTTFRRVILPALMPSIYTGFALGFGRALGEYGSIVFIAGNLPMRTEITPLLIITQLEQFNYPAATAIACVTLIISFTILLSVNLVQWLSRRKLRP